MRASRVGWVFWIVFLVATPVQSQEAPVTPSTDLKAGMYMVYQWNTTLLNGTVLTAQDRYEILSINELGFIRAKINWGVAGFPKNPDNDLDELRVYDPSNPSLRSIIVIVEVGVKNGLYVSNSQNSRIIVETTVSREEASFKGQKYDVIKVSQKTRDKLVQLRTLEMFDFYYEDKGGILLFGNLETRTTPRTKSTLELVETNAFSIDPTPLPSQIWGPAAFVIGLSLIVLAVLRREGRVLRVPPR